MLLETKKSEKRKPLSFAFKLLVSAGFVSWLLFRLDWTDVMKRILEVDGNYLLLYLALLLFGMFLSAKKWRLLAQHKGFARPQGDFFQAYLTGAFINNFFPSTIGGDTYRALWLGRRDGKLSPAISTVLIDRFTGLWAAMVLALFFSLFHWELVLAHPFWLFLNALIVVLLLLDFLPLLLRKIPRAKKWLSLLPEKILHLIGELGSYPFRKVMVPALFLSLVFNFVGVGLSNLVLFRALGGGVELFEYLSVIFLITIVSSIPISINNIGLKEWAYAVFFGYLGASVEAAVTVALVSRILQMFVSFASLPFYLRSRDLLGREQEGGRR